MFQFLLPKVEMRAPFQTQPFQDALFRTPVQTF